MKIAEIVGEDYEGSWDRLRIACRGIVIEDGRILLSYEKATGQWMLPGGGLEGNESEKDCCVREFAEETGKLIEADDCVVEVIEYYHHWKGISYYFPGRIIGSQERKLTSREEEVGMEPRWLPIAEALEEFSHYNDYADDEMRCGLYLREYTALKELFSQKAEQERKRTMDEFFKPDNLDYIFECEPHQGEFFACANDAFSPFSEKELFTREWAWSFPSGRYVILVCQRHSVYRNGERVYLNDAFENVVSKDSRFRKPYYVLISEKENEYIVPSWGEKRLKSHIVQNENDALMPKIYSTAEEAAENASWLSSEDNAVSVLEWFADYDMY